MQSIPRTDTEIARLTEQGLEQQNARDYAKALQTFQRVLDLDPNNVIAHYSMGYLHAQQNDFAAALPHLKKVTTLRPDFAQGRQALSIAQQELAKAKALPTPGHAPMASTAASATKSKSSSSKQKSKSRRTIVDIMEAAQVLQQQGQSEAALALYVDFLKDCDEDVRYIARYNASVILMELKRNDEVQPLLEEAISEKPDFFQGYFALGTFLEKIGQPIEAIQMWESALRSPLINMPVHDEIRCQLLTNIGRVHELQRNYASAEEALQRSLEINPHQGPVLHHWLHLRQKQCKWPSSYGLKLSHDEIVKHASPMTILSMSDDPAAQLRAAQTFVREKVGTFPRMVDRETRYGHDKLRIGYLSSDLSMHAVSLLTVELFETHDREKVEVHAFCWSKEDGTAFRRRVRDAFDVFHTIGGLSDEEAATLIKEHEIDVLVDLQGLTNGARPNILARGPAPIQISWLGFPGPCALPYVDYVIADKFIFPDSLKPFFTETPLYLETLFQVSDSKREVGPTPTRASLGLPDEKFIFCAFNNNYKITPEIFESWMRILRNAPHSVLWLLEDNRWSKDSLIRAACAHGISPDRLYFAGRVLPSDYLARFKAADLFLDTTPYNAGTTANDALWAGLPILTLSGNTYVSRMAGSLLLSAGFKELVTFNRDDYETKAIHLANNITQIESYKSKLVRQRETGSLFSTQRFCIELENALLKLANESNDGKKRAKQAKSSKLKLLVRGWRGINHSYAMVNQYQLAALTLNDDIEFLHEDLPFIAAHWSKQNNNSGFDEATRQRLENIKAYKGQAVDACYSISAPVNFFRGKSNRNATFIVTETGLSESNFSEHSRNLKHFSKSQNWAITPTVWSKKKLVDYGIPYEKIFVLPHGIDPAVFKKYQEEERNRARQNLGIKPDEFVFLNVGGSFWNKGIDLLLRAYCELRQKNQSIRLILKDNRQLYGIGSDSILSSIAEKHPGLLTDDTIASIITIPGTLSLNQLTDLYNLADLYVSPYRAEGFNMPVIEAMACGLPVLVTDGGATDDFVTEDFGKKISGKLVMPSETELPVGGYFIEPDINDLRDKMAARMVDWTRTAHDISTSFHWGSISNRLMKFLIDSENL